MNEIDTVNKKMTIASTVQPRLTGQLLDEQDMLKANMKDKDTITSVEVKALLEEAIDVIKIKPSKKK
eukprot:5396337-Karenia_brevis.AAC.1